jgi:3-hydroxymyristoyl/3-hydroxydecanoyl-(acyl carrier protein) dehydratase
MVVICIANNLNLKVFYFVNTHKTKFEASVVPEHELEIRAR